MVVSIECHRCAIFNIILRQYFLTLKYFFDLQLIITIFCLDVKKNTTARNIEN